MDKNINRIRTRNINNKIHRDKTKSDLKRDLKIFASLLVKIFLSFPKDLILFFPFFQLCIIETSVRLTIRFIGCRHEAKDEESLQSSSTIRLASPRPRTSSSRNGGRWFETQLVPRTLGSQPLRRIGEAGSPEQNQRGIQKEERNHRASNHHGLQCCHVCQLHSDHEFAEH